MNVSLTPELERMVQEKVASGKYNSASEVVREGLRLIAERDALHQARLEDLRRDIDVGLEQLRRGEGRPFDRAQFDKRLQERLQAYHENQGQSSEATGES